jgi:cytochrome oxidase Cu insertion factor (SCO1/SenC/PrrC family)
MRELRESLHPRSDWRFLTAADTAALAPVLADFNQDAVRLRDEEGEPSARMRHVLKVFLVDHTGGVRNIYSTGVLDPRLVLNDVRTVVEEGSSP